MNRLTDNTLEELENLINDAADGLLGESQVEKLEQDLQAHPELLNDYREIMDMPDLTGAYGDLNAYRNDFRVHNILEEIRQSDQLGSFDNITMMLFKRYALAASILILALTSVFYMAQPDILNGEITFEEIYYPDADQTSEDYITYLDEWMER
ncbi:MAG: hypothetical protein WDZ38_02520 [Balneolaceae bacterium]